MYHSARPACACGSRSRRAVSPIFWTLYTAQSIPSVFPECSVQCVDTVVMHVFCAGRFCDAVQNTRRYSFTDLESVAVLKRFCEFKVKAIGSAFL